MREKPVWSVLWELVSPILLYLLLSVSLTGVLEILLPSLGEPENAMWLLALVNGFQIPVFYRLYRRQRPKEKGNSPVWKRSYGPPELLLAALGGLFLARGFNGLIGLTPLPRIFSGYEAVTESVYRGSLLSQILASVAAASVLEELLMRGLLYERFRGFFSDRRPAIVLSALVFAIFHGNVVQGTYAFLMGLYFVWLYETYRSLIPAILAHAAANASSIVLEQTGWLNGLYTGLPMYFLTTALFLAAGAFCWNRARGKSGRP